MVPRIEPEAAISKGSKSCRICLEAFPLGKFPIRSNAKDGRRNECKACLVKRTSGRDRREYSRAYQAKNAEAIAKQRRDNPSIRPAGYYREYRDANLEAVQANEQRYREANRHKETERRHTRRSVTPFTPEDRDYVRIVVNDPCVYCGGAGGTLEHIIPITAGGNNEWLNLAGACQSCNSSKNNKSLLDFMLYRLAA